MQIIDGFSSLFGEAYKYCAGFGVFAVLTLYSMWFVYWNVPETKGLSLEEIERKYCPDLHANNKQEKRSNEADGSSLLGETIPGIN